jgi:phosphoglycerol transferase MdoB-like AlkP superfamily enzyme
MKEWLKRDLSFVWQKGSVFQVLFYRLGLLLFLMSVQRLAFYFYNQSLFDKVTFSSLSYMMYGGVQFDLTAMLYFNLPYVVLLLIPFPFRYNSYYQKAINWLFVIANSLAFMMNSADVIYYRFSLRRTSFSVLKEFQNESSHLMKILSQFVFTYWYVTLFLILLLVVFVWAVRLVRVRVFKPVNQVSFFGFNLVFLAGAIALSIIGIRGGVGKHVRPITLSNASKYVENVNERAIVLNTPFSFFRSMETEGFERKSYYRTEEELKKVYSPVHYPSDSSHFQPLNVVVIIWESFGKEYTGFYNKHLDDGGYKGYTPFMDSLLAQSHVFYYSYANGRKSIDAMPSVLTSIPSLQEPFVLSHYSGNKVKGLPLLLKEKGYYSAFFHGAPNGSMGFDAFAKQAGFDDYFGKDEYNNDEDFDGTWGIWDENFLSFYADEMDGFTQPFLSTVFTVSSHDPFKLPEKYEGVFPEGPGPLLHSIGYTDYCMKQFFDKVSKMAWFENTLFVITADHASTSFDPTYKTMVGSFSVPIFFYRPNNVSDIAVDSSLIQQVDIMPSVLGYLGYDEPYLGFGHNVFEEVEDRFVVNFRDDVYQFFEADYLVQYDGEKVVGVYLFKTDYLMDDNLKGQLPDIESKAVEKIQAFIQQYDNRMIDNRLTVEG